MKIELEGLTKRVPGTGDFITIDYAKCNNCERCLIICIIEAIWLNSNRRLSIYNVYTNLRIIVYTN